MTPYPAVLSVVSTSAREMVVFDFAVIVAVLSPKLIVTLSAAGIFVRASRTLCVHEEGQCIPDTPTTYWWAVGAVN